MIKLKVLSLNDCEKIREWRNSIDNNVYRTSHYLTKEMQEKWYYEEVCNRNANSRYLGIYDDLLIGYCGINNIQWENGIGEIGITLNPEEIRKGYGKQSLELILKIGFCNLRLYNIFGECYTCNPKLGFWKKMIEKYNGYTTILPYKKFYNDNFYSSLYFNFNCNDYKRLKEIKK
jgi:RimJ/RimL family protein N-acetyltransferase